MPKRICKIKDTDKCAKETALEVVLRPQKNSATVIGLKGELGSGKTHFTKALAKNLGVSETVLSPTFVIEKIYKLPVGENFKHLIHIDAYRLESGNELRTLGWDEILSDPKNLIVIEWPEKVKGLMPKDAMEIEFRHVDEKTREISWK